MFDVSEKKVFSFKVSTVKERKHICYKSIKNLSAVAGDGTKGFCNLYV